jgi:hypothetical protein
MEQECGATVTDHEMQPEDGPGLLLPVRGEMSVETT